MNSTLFPDGLISAQWVQKYLYLNPSVFISFHELSSSGDTSHNHDDTEIVSTLNKLKTQLTKRDVRLIAVVIGNNASEDRIYQLRRATGLPPRTGLLHVPTSSTEVEKETFVETVCQLAYSQALEFYTNVSKRVRRKRGSAGPKNNSPDLDQQRQLNKSPLSSAGWDIRYLFKLAALSEFKQELDTALSAYEHTYESLLELCENNNDFLESRWNEIWTVIDAVVYKMVKISLYLDQPNVSYRKFSLHLAAMENLMKQKGQDTGKLDNVIWKADQFSRIAQLISSTQSLAVPNELPLAPAPDDNYPSVRLPRSGFLYLRSAEIYKDALMVYTKTANDEKKQEDETSKGEELKKKIFDSLSYASSDFSLGDTHRRSVAYTLYQMAELSYREENWEAALKGFKSTLETYKGDQWIQLQRRLLEGVKTSAFNLGNLEDYVISALELKTINNEENDDHSLSSELQKLALEDNSTKVVQGIFSPFDADFVFENPSFNVGLPARAQIQIIPPFNPGSWTLDSIKVEFYEGFDPLIIENDPKEAEKEVYFIDSSNKSTNLSFRNGKSKLIQINQIPKSLGTVEVKKITANMKFPMENNKTTVEYSFEIPLKPITGSSTIPWYKNGKWMHKRNENPRSSQIAPRPAKIKMTTDPVAVNTVSAGELLSLGLVVDNQEDEEINLNLEVKVSTVEGSSVDISWINGAGKSSGLNDGDDNNGKADHLVNISQTPGSITYPLTFQIPTAGATGVTIDFIASYTLPDDKSPIKEAMSLSIPVTKPFRVNFDVVPRVHPDPWKSSFIPEDVSNSEDSQTIVAHSPLIHKRWALTASLLFLGEDEVEILGTTLQVQSSNEEEAYCTLIEEPSDDKTSSSLVHNDGIKLSYIFDTRRNGTKDIRTVSAEAYLKIKWKRSISHFKQHQDENAVNEYHIPVVRLNLPLYEPRVILDYEWIDSSYLRLSYYIENATSHILTYSIGMGSSSIFAFEGPKSLSMRVMPFTRRLLEYELLPLKPTGEEDLYIPQLKIHDTFYKRTLVVIPANGSLVTDRADIYIPQIAQMI